MRDKECFKCGVRQPIVNFYKHPMMADGHLGKCKSCTRFDVRKNYAQNIEKYRAYDRQRYASNPNGRTPRTRSPEKRKASWSVHNAIRDERLKKLPCEMCGNPKSEAHHHDYSQPLNVMWLCRKHHKDMHRMPSTPF